MHNLLSLVRYTIKQINEQDHYIEPKPLRMFDRELHTPRFFFNSIYFCSAKKVSGFIFP